MSFSLSHGKQLDVGRIGICDDALPRFEQGPIDLCAWFGNDHPLELEIGSGKGTFLVQQAARTSQINYIGLEYATAFWRYAADRCRRHELTNVRLVRVEAAYFIRNYVPEHIVQQVHVYFPDPWPKKRHHKRRLIQAPFLQQLYQCLADGALVRIATDHTEYFQWIREQAAGVRDLYEQRPFGAGDSAGEGERVGTNFERKYRREGRPFYGLILRKRRGI